MQNEEQFVTLPENYKNCLASFGKDLHLANHQPLIGIIRGEILLFMVLMLKLVWFFL